MHATGANMDFTRSLALDPVEWKASDKLNQVFISADATVQEIDFEDRPAGRTKSVPSVVPVSA
jgi:hypothetical protein